MMLLYTTRFYATLIIAHSAAACFKLTVTASRVQLFIQTSVSQRSLYCLGRTCWGRGIIIGYKTLNEASYVELLGAQTRSRAGRMRFMYIYSSMVSRRTTNWIFQCLCMYSQEAFLLCSRPAAIDMSCSLLAERKRLVLLVVLVILTSEQSAHGAAGTSSMALPGCPDKCGNISVPYPFGFDDGCFQEPFGVYCEDDQAVYLQDGKRLKVLEFNLSKGEIRIQKRIANSCDDSTQSTILPGQPKMFMDGGMVSNGIPYVTVSTRKNKFTAIGCATTAIIQHWSQHNNYTSGCVSFCNEDSIEDSTQCNGMGCCQTSVPGNLSAYQPSFLAIGGVDYSTVRKFSPCSYAFIVEQNWFKFNASYVKSREYGELYGIKGRGVPLVLDWSVGDQTCDEAKRNKSSYLCASTNSECIIVHNGAGYLCQCSSGYEGNPYLEGGCQDINECDDPSLYPCKGGHCRNTVGSYTCSCPSGTQSKDPKNIPCTTTIGLSIGIGVGSATSFIILVLIAIFLTKRFKHRRARKLRQKFFDLNRGQLLEQLVSQRADIAERMIITMDELEKATNNFDKARELGGGGHGTVYKGILSDQHVVAIKKSNIVVQKEINEFINEVAILSQINHKNIVKLIGCCLETEVPLLVYEFISNKTLYHHLHVEGPRSLSWGNRLRIAAEIANALSYLHSSVSVPIIHRDIKPSNILLDDNLTSKVSDFGASRYIPIDKTGLTTKVQGTMGYLDPVYFYRGRLNDKSDVYSFGVILVELLTKKKTFPYLSSEGEGLVADFARLYDVGNLVEILDPQVIEEGGKEVQEVAQLAASCTKLRGEDRPTMREVNRSLECILSSEKCVEDSILVANEGQSTRPESNKWHSL